MRQIHHLYTPGYTPGTPRILLAGYTADTPQNYLCQGTAGCHQPSSGVKVRGLGVSRVYQGCVRNVSRVYLWVCPECIQGVYRVLPRVHLGFIWDLSGVSGMYLVYPIH